MLNNDFLLNGSTRRGQEAEMAVIGGGRKRRV